jgi:hypothetical protein
LTDVAGIFQEEYELDVREGVTATFGDVLWALGNKKKNRPAAQPREVDNDVPIHKRLNSKEWKYCIALHELTNPKCHNFPISEVGATSKGSSKISRAAVTLAIDALLVDLNDPEWNSVIEKYCTDDYVKEENLDFVTAARLILEDPLAVLDLTELQKLALSKFRIEIDPHCAIDISPEKPNSSMTDKLRKDKKRRLLENQSRLKFQGV